MDKKIYHQNNKRTSQIATWSIFLVVMIIIIGFLSFILQQNQESSVGYLIKNSFVSPFSSKATLSLQTNPQKYSLKTQFPVEVWLNIPSGKKVNGVDVVMNYDSSYLKTSPKQVGVTQTSNLNQLILPKSSLKSGEVKFSVIAGPGKFIEGKRRVKIAEVKFLPLKKGNTSIKLKFLPSATNDSNIVLFRKGTDILENVNNLKLHIK